MRRSEMLICVTFIVFAMATVSAAVLGLGSPWGGTAGLAVADTAPAVAAQWAASQSVAVQSAGAGWLAMAPAPASAATVPAAGTAAVRMVVSPTGNEARYRVQERLVGHDLSNNAVGATRDITGAIALDSTGSLLPAESKIVVDIRSLKSDRDRRDGFVQHRLLETDQFPAVTLVPTAIRGTVSSLWTMGSARFDLAGGLTIHGVTRRTLWHVTAHQDAGRVSGTASTGFTFADFGLTQPRVPVVLSVADTIRLEYDFTLLRQAVAGRALGPDARRVAGIASQ